MTPLEVFILALSLSVMLLFFILPRAPTLSSWSRRNPRTFPSAAWSVSICLARAARSGSSSPAASASRSEEHTSELQSQSNLVCRLLLEKKNPKHSGRQLHSAQASLDAI